MFVEYFQNLFSYEGIQEETFIPQDIFPELSQHHWQAVSRPFTGTDVDLAIQSIGALKAPGPDGFQALFYHENWEIIKEQVYELVLNVLHGKGMPDHLNDTFITLIPKIDSPQNPSQFRPIGLCNVAYKIISKAIVERLKPLMPILTSVTQTSFVPGRQITDNIVIVQEVIHSMRHKQGNKRFMALEIDFEKAYDRLKWDFIRDTLVQMNLPINLMHVIMECVTSSSLQVL